MKKLKKAYLNIFIVSAIFLVIIAYAVTFVLTLGDLSSPLIVDFDQNLSGVFNNVVVVDDAVADYFYYKGLNYTHNPAGTLPSLVDKNYYPDSKLVAVEITYSGKDINNNNRGYVSNTERQDTYVYHKISPVVQEGSDFYTYIELIENPFTDRPTDMGFNGWVTNYNGVTIEHDNSYYLKTAKVPVTYTGDETNKIVITFNASWVTAEVGQLTTNNANGWNNAFSSINSAGMTQITTTTFADGYYSMEGYFERVIIPRYSSYAGYYNSNGVYQSSGTCGSSGGCPYYRLIGVENFNRSYTYYELSPPMNVVNNNSLPIPQIPQYDLGYTASDNMAGYFKTILIPRYSSIVGYYDNLGTIQTTGTCNTSAGCTYYEYLNYYDQYGNPNILDVDDTYYYLTTRDTNIIVMRIAINTTWSSSNNKPFTLTTLHNGTKYNFTWTTNRAISAYNDTNIENITIASGTGVGTSTAPATNMTTSRYFYTRWNNVRIGRGIARSGTNASFTGIIGGVNANTGSAANTTKYRLIVESGFYTTVTLGYTTGSNNHYLNARGIYGNDYDRVTNNNASMLVNYVLAGMWGGNVRSSTVYDVSLDHTVKSGQYGVSKYDNATGIYIGGRNTGTIYSARRLKLEGGWAYNVIGGPMSDTARTNHNDVYFQMTGGEVDIVIGGAGTTTTYGNRLLQITGGRVNYSAFGGSNGYNAGNGDGQITGDSYIYVGGNAEIGNPTLVNNGSTLWGSEAGSIFGNGNGRSGYADIGSLRNPNIIIADQAVINRNVYGGGNFGTSGRSGTTTTNIIMHNGTVKGSIYGGGNNNGAGKTNITATINITTYGGAVEGEIYGGSNAVGTVYGSVNLDIQGGTFGSIYGGGRGGYTNTSNVGTYVRDDISIVLGSSTSSPIILNSVYGGSAFGGVNSTAQNPPASNSSINILVNNATITNNLFGGSQGNTTFSPVVAGGVTITVEDGNINNIYGGNDYAGSYLKNGVIVINDGDINNVYGGGNQVEANNTNITVNDGTIGSVYGGGRLALIDKSTVVVNGGTITSMYGGCEQANVTIDTNIKVNNGTVTTIYGGSNQSGNIPASFVEIVNGNIGSVYGGNNAGGITTTTDVKVQGGTLSYVYGGGKLASIGTSNILVNAGTIGSIFGGSEQASVSNSTNITTNGGTSTNIFGGSNQSGTVPISNIVVNSGTSTNIYGGNNAGGSTATTNVNILGGSLTNVYGGGKLADTQITNVDINTNNTISNVYGGGEDADVTTRSIINVIKGTITTLYGGSNLNGTVAESNITVTTGTIANLFGGNNLGGSTTTTNIIVNNGNIGNITGGGNQANTTTSNITVNNSSSLISNIYGGGSAANVTTSNVDILGGSASNVFGGSNQSGTVTTSYITVNNSPIITSLYGGNNMGGATINSNIDTFGGTIGNIYGGGNQAELSGNATLKISDTTISHEIYGGGKDGETLGNTNVLISDSSIEESVYAGGKGETAIVYGSTTLNIEGTTEIGDHVFGGGNAGSTGTELLNNSSSIVNIAGATIGGNVYGGANTSVVYGTVELNIGYGLTSPALDEENIYIGGTVFGGGEANASGSEEFDYSFISVTTGIDIHIREDNIHTITVLGSLFGSGNASSTTGYSYITLENYGKASDHKRNISIQRADIVTLDNSIVELFGATDRTNEYSSVLFTISRVGELKMKNNSTIYLETGTNLLKKFTSLVDIGGVETKAAVTIEDGVVTKNVDNRLYAIDGKNINIATNEAVTTYGEVYGMTFFGMYMRDRDDNVVEAFYSSIYDEGDTVLPGEFYVFSTGSYVLGAHLLNHDIGIDGYYSNYQNEEEEDVVEVKYIIPTPESSNYYMWTIGEAVSSYDVDLIASKFSTLGSYELSLINTTEANVMFTILGVNFNGLESDIELVNKNQIPRIALDGKADTRMSLVMESSNTGWITVGETTFLTDNVVPVQGTEEYLKENSTIVPTLLFNLYHSKNLQTDGFVGTVVISMLAVIPIDDLSNEIVRMNINVNITRELFAGNEYEGAMTPGEKHDYFTSTATDITNKSKLTSYYSLYIESATTIYQTGYHRALVSSFVIPEHTKFTMIDLTTPTPTYYYYEVTATDVTAAQAEFAIHNEASYPLSRFTKMGSTTTTNKFNDVVQNSIYYDAVHDIASEEFIFIVDYSKSGISADYLDQTLLIEIRDFSDQTKIGVLGINYGNLTYNIYNNRDAIIDITANLSKSNIYIGESTVLNLTANFIQQVVNYKTVHDTTYYSKKMGIKISMYDSNNNLLNASSLLGVRFIHNSISYYPRMDGIVRINISPRIANVFSQITIDTSNSTLPSGTYKIKIDSFGSVDGIYYGLVASDTLDINLNVLNNIYGLSSTLPDGATIVDGITGTTTLNNNLLAFNINYSSGLANPNLRLSLKRRKYDQIYSLDYEKVDIMEYITSVYPSIGTPEDFEYLITNSPLSNQIINLYLKDNLVTGTYRVTFSLYDNNAYIGEVYNYIIIR